MGMEMEIWRAFQMDGFGCKFDRVSGLCDGAKWRGY